MAATGKTWLSSVDGRLLEGRCNKTVAGCGGALFCSGCFVV